MGPVSFPDNGKKIYALILLILVAGFIFLNTGALKGATSESDNERERITKTKEVTIEVKPANSTRSYAEKSNITTG